MPKHVRGKSIHHQPAHQPARQRRDTTIPGTHIKENELVQARRFLSHQRTFLDSSPRFTKDAICELERVFHKKPETRTANLASNLSDAGKQLLTVFESELEDARARGITADWWSEGINRKGVTGAEKQAYAAARRALNAGGMGIAAMMGVSELGMEEFTSDNLADTTEHDLEDPGAGPTADELKGVEEEGKICRGLTTIRMYTGHCPALVWRLEMRIW
ncbi:hypothetical protein G7Y79_00008g024320 [Physcia stellaris]|nr:hypothetical protein G7Y79_00008g024320 [Physcia stellaris]